MSRAMAGRSLLPAAEVALVALTLTVVATFWRLFDGGGWFYQLAAFALVSHLVALGGRRLGWSIGVTALVSAVALVFAVGIVLYPSTTYAGIPTGATFSAIGDDFGQVWDLFQSVQAPTAATTPFLLAAGLALWWAAFVADWAAFRLWVPFEAVVPAGTVFVFASLFAAHRGQVLAASVFVLAVFVFLLLHRVARQQTSGGWVSTDVARGTNALLRAGTMLAACAVLAAAVIGPHLPEAQSDAVIGWRGTGEGPSARTTVSPLVQIQPRLVDQSNQELFTVESSRRSYWRLTALDQFDGDVWSSNGEYVKASGNLPGTAPADTSGTVVTQRYSIQSLATIWLPAAYRPASVNPYSANVRYADASSTLIVGNDLPTSDGVQYDVTSVIPNYQEAALESANGFVPNDVANRDTELPSSVPQSVQNLALRVVQAQTTTYGKALALQNFFRDNFQYDLHVQPGQGVNAMEDFLFHTKAGYCEQFAGTYAAMARSIGLPTRVAVGFTPGEEDATHPGLYHVLGLHAHAWPEVYFGGQGWVPFEPTPGRGNPAAEQYTHVTEAQASPEGEATTLPATTTPASTETTINPFSTATTVKNQDVVAGQLQKPAEPSFWSPERPVGKALVGIGAVVIVVLAYALLVPLGWYLYRRRRRQRAVDPDAQVRLAWQETVEALAVLGVTPSRTETASEFADRAEDALESDAYRELAGTLEAADFSADGVDDDAARRALAMSDAVAATVRRTSTREQRVRSALDPRPPERRRPPKRGRSLRRTRRDAPAIEILRSAYK